MSAYRWLDAEQTIIRRASDGACIPADPRNADFAAINPAEIAAFQRFETLPIARAMLLAEVEAIAEAKRIAVAGTSSGSKLATYQAKYETAVAALAGNEAALAALTPEATARGETTEALALLVKTLGDQWRAAGLAIDAAYQAHKAAISQLTLAEALDYDTGEGWPF